MLIVMLSKSFFVRGQQRMGYIISLNNVELIFFASPFSYACWVQILRDTVCTALRASGKVRCALGRANQLQHETTSKTGVIVLEFLLALVAEAFSFSFCHRLMAQG